MHTFSYSDERFADIQMLRYRLDGFDALPLGQKKLIYYLSEATLWGRDITFDQFGKYNLLIRKVLETIYRNGNPDGAAEAEWRALEVYLKRVWFSNGIYHHYGCEKMEPGFSSSFFRRVAAAAGISREVTDVIEPVIFDPTLLPKRVNKAAGADLVLTSACNYYDGVTQSEAESYYAAARQHLKDDEPPSLGLNSTLVKDDSGIVGEQTWKIGGRYGETIERIVYWLELSRGEACNGRQRRVIDLLISYYRTGDLKTFNDYCIEWVGETEAPVDFINGFIEVYGDPLGIKGSWEGIVEYRDVEATRRTRLISDNAQWFEDHSPVDPRFRKPEVRGVVANVICAAMLGGDEYPSTAIGINLPNADWIRARHGSKSITISNITDAYNKAARGSGLRQEFVIDQETLTLIERYGDTCDDLHTDLHECLGHGSGQLLPGVSAEALKAYGNTIEEARADLFALYYLADAKMVELGLLPDATAYRANYYTYMLNGLMTQLTRIRPGHKIEEAHMRNRALIARWCLEHGGAQMVRRYGKTYVFIGDYTLLRRLFAGLLAEIQRIKSEGDYEAARSLVERYAVDIDPQLHDEVLERYARLDLAPYKGFINPVLRPVTDARGEITDIQVSYDEGYAEQMLRYSRDYSVTHHE